MSKSKHAHSNVVDLGGTSMPRRRECEESVSDGVKTVELFSWIYFSDYINKHLLNSTSYVFRGQGDERWPLKSSLDRHLEKAGLASTRERRTQHLERFWASTLGRRGPNPRDLDEDEMWALGQHHFLKTPLLDWTSSPFVAAFFACADENAPASCRAAVYGLDERMVEEWWDEVVQERTAAEERNFNDHRHPVRFVRPLVDENANLVSQGGLFTHTAPGVDVVTWVKESFPGSRRGVLIKLTFPRSGCQAFITALNRMNINYRSLFPDLYGSAWYCNHACVHEGYC